MEFDVTFCLDTIHAFAQEKDDNEFVLWLTVKKFTAESDVECYAKKIEQHVGIFYKFIDEFYTLYHQFHTNFLLEESIEDKLQIFIRKSKQFHILTYHTKALILLSKVYIKQGRYTEAMSVLNKITTHSNTSNYFAVVAKCYLGYCYHYLRYDAKAKETLSEIKEKIENICSITDRFDFYYLVNLYEKNDEIAVKCVKLGMLLNNKEKVARAIEMMSNSERKEELRAKVDKVTEENDKLLALLSMFKTTAKEAIDVIYKINKNSYEQIIKE